LENAAANELLRRFSLVNMAREVREDIEWDGVLLKKGDMIVAPSPLFGLDERLNADPLKVDFQRKSPQHETFGMGDHICPGAHLGSLEIRIALEEWLKRIPDFSVKPDPDICFQGGIIGSLAAVPLVWIPA
jgi:cytochrome P450